MKSKWLVVLILTIIICFGEIWLSFKNDLERVKVVHTVDFERLYMEYYILHRENPTMDTLFLNPLNKLLKKSLIDLDARFLYTDSVIYLTNKANPAFNDVSYFEYSLADYISNYGQGMIYSFPKLRKLDIYDRLVIYKTDGSLLSDSVRLEACEEILDNWWNVYARRKFGLEEELRAYPDLPYCDDSLLMFDVVNQKIMIEHLYLKDEEFDLDEGLLEGHADGIAQIYLPVLMPKDKTCFFYF